MTHDPVPHADRDGSEQPSARVNAQPTDLSDQGGPVQTTSMFNSFIYPCRACGATIHVVDGQEQPHEHADVPRVTRLTNAWWQGYDAAAPRAEAAEAERDEIAGRLSALLCELTGGRLSKPTYDVRTMVTEIDSRYDGAQQEERAELERLRAEVTDNVWNVDPDIGQAPGSYGVSSTDRPLEVERIARAVASVTPCSCSAQRARAERAEAERDALKADFVECYDQLTTTKRRANDLEGRAWRAEDALAAERERVAAGDASDGHHTHNELYEYRMLYNAHASLGWLAAGVPVVKSWRHSDGEPCFGGGWFIVTATLSTGQVSNHYRAEHWDLFVVPEVDLPPVYDGHTPTDAAERLRAALAAPDATGDDRD